GEISELHPSALPYLINRLIPARIAEDQTLVRNATGFLNGLALLGAEEVKKLLQVHVIKGKGDDPAYGGCIVGIISADPTLLVGLDKSTMLRTRGVLEKRA